MGFSSEEYIEMCDKMMAELNEAEEEYFEKIKDIENEQIQSNSNRDIEQGSGN